jgi:polyhydroxyalkanoate synthase
MPVPTEQSSTIDRVRREIERNAQRARNGIKIVAGTTRPNLKQSPKDVVWRFGRAELWHYRNDNVRFSPPLLIVPSLVSRSYVLDLTPGNSFIERLVQHGLDVYMLDWGVADERDAGNRLEDYVDHAIPGAIRQIRRRSQAADVNLLGYCFGGVLTLLHAAHHTSSPIRSLTIVATPVDFSGLPMADAFGRTEVDFEQLLGDDGNIPPQVMLQSFRSLTPMGDVTNYVNLLDRLWNDDYVAAHQALTGWANDHVPFPGAAGRQTSQMLARDNALVTGRIELGGDRCSLADITVPLLSVIGLRDHLIPPASSEAVMDLVGSTDKRELRQDGGHIGLALGKSAHKTTIPTIIEFLEKRSESPS